jgi:histidinol-phosphate phosphatase family protein
MTERAVFLDRDGTINKEINYLSKKEQVEILPKVPEAIRMLNESGFLVIIITNQSGVARNYFSMETLSEINSHILNELGKQNARIDDIFICPHHPDDGCECRKPGTGLLKDVASKYEIDFGSSYMVGDKFTDLKTGKNAGCKTVLVLTGYGKEEMEVKGDWEFTPDLIAGDLYEAAIWIREDGE